MNHGGVAIVAAPGVHLSPVTVIGHTPTTFELTSFCLGYGLSLGHAALCKIENRLQVAR